MYRQKKTKKEARLGKLTHSIPLKPKHTYIGTTIYRSPFKQLGESDEFIEDTEENDKIVRNTLINATTPPPYVTIRRSRPTTPVTESTKSDNM